MLQHVRSISFKSRTQAKEESLATSLLGWMDLESASKDQLTEAFCRDIDAYSFEFQVKQVKTDMKTSWMILGKSGRAS